MKYKKTKKLLAFILCFIMIFNGGISVLAENLVTDTDLLSMIQDASSEDETPTEDVPVTVAETPLVTQATATEAAETVPETAAQTETVAQTETETEVLAEITRYDYKSDEVNVRVTLTNPEDLPDAAELVVEAITLPREAKQNIEAAAEEEGIFVEEIKAFDIKFMLDGEEVQPGATVKVRVTVPEFKPSEEASAVYHVDENNAVESMDSEVKLGGAVEFEAPHFSTYVIVDGTIVNDATKTITVTLKHYNKDGYVAGSTPETTYQLYADNTIELPVGGEIYNYIIADNWKPDTVVVDYTDSSLTDATYTSSTDLKEISLEDSATVWVYYTPDQSQMYGEVGFYDYTLYAEETVNGESKTFSINDILGETYKTEKVLLVGDASYDRSESSSVVKYDGTVADWNGNRATYEYGPGEVFGSNGIYLDSKGDVLFAYPNPGFFNTENYSVTTDNGEVYLRRYYDDHQVGFTRMGNTYTFDQVLYPYIENEVEKTGYYTKGGDSGWDKNGYYFYPLDHCYDSSEDSYYADMIYKNHNKFWGMRYDVTFTIGDYVGDLSFESMTRGDFLAVLDGDILVYESIKAGNEDLSSGKVDLWTKLGIDKTSMTEEQKSEEHTLTILFMDRFAEKDESYGRRTCNIEFTLPNASVKSVPKVNSSDEVSSAKTTVLTLKTVDQNNASLAGAVFQLKNSSTNATETMTTTAEGVSFDSLAVGEYHLVLAAAPDGCVAEASAWKLSVKESSSGTLEISMYEEATGKTVNPEANGSYIIGVTKVEGTQLTLRTVLNDANATKLGGAKFKLESEKGTFSEVISSDYITGEINFSGLKAGTYTLFHVKAPTGCQLIGTDMEWTVTVTEDEGSYSVSLEPTVTESDGVYIYQYEGSYTPPEGSFVYDKTAKLINWNDRTYEIDISAKSIASETIKHLDTTYGMFVFDVSSTMGNTSSETQYTYNAGTNYSDLDKDYLYHEDATSSYIVYVEGKWQKLNGSSWIDITGETTSYSLKRSNEKIEVLKEVAINYIENLANGSKQGKLGVVTFCSYSDVDEIWNLNTSFFETDGSLNKQILTKILSIDHKQDTYPHAGLMAAYKQLVGSFEYDFQTREFSYGTDNDIYTYARENNIPLYVILVSDGKAWSDGIKPTEDMASYLKSKGVTVYTVATNSDNEGDYKSWLKNYVASFGCAYEVSEQNSLAEIFSQIQKTISASLISDADIKDYIDPRFVILDDNGKAITEDYHCNDTCPEDCSEHKSKTVNVTYNGKTGTVGYDDNGQYIIWENQTITAEEDHWCIEVKVRDEFFGGNNVTTNIDNISKITTPGNQDGYVLPNPQVNVKADLEVNDNTFVIYKGETVPTTGEALKVLFNETELKNQYNQTWLNGSFTLKWYTNPACTDEADFTDGPTTSSTYYLKVTYNAGIPTEESKANTTEGGEQKFVGDENTGTLVAVNSNDSDLLYGVYMINVWELIKRVEGTNTVLEDAEFTLSVGNTVKYTGKSGNDGVVVWYEGEGTETLAKTIDPATYTLKETKAPDGYQLITTEWTATKVADKGWTTLPSGTGISDTPAGEGITRKYIDNVAKTTSITVEKDVTGNIGETNKAFSFTATLPEGSTFPSGEGYTVEGNVATFQLKDGETVTFNGLPLQTKLVIEEDNEDYTVSITKKSGDVGIKVSGSEVEVTTTETASTILFTNMRTGELDTGIKSNTPTPLIIMLAVVVVTAVAGMKIHADRERARRRARARRRHRR